MKNIISLCLSLFLLFSLSAVAFTAGAAEPNGAAARAVTITTVSAVTQSYTYTVGNVSLPYRIYYPTGYSTNGSVKYPVLLFLHGAGERGTDNYRHVDANDGLLRRLIQSDECVVIAPQCPNNAQWVNTDWGKGSYDSTVNTASAYLDAAKSLLLNEINKGGIDRNRVWVSGISMGGYGTWNLAMYNPDLFAAAIPVCGAGDLNKAYALVDMPIWTFHGDADPIVPVSGTREMYAAVKAAGGNNITYTEYPGVDHGSWNNAFAEENLLTWLFAQTKAITGDIDNNKVVNASDILNLKAMILSNNCTAEELAVGDLNGNARLDAGDMMIVKNIIMNK